jgi:hypothetical protein
MAARQPKLRLPRKPPLTTTRYRHMVRELVNLSNKYGLVLDQVIPSATRLINEAHQRSKDMGAAPRAGAPKVWIQGQLVRLWIWVRALQIEDPKLTDRDACIRLALDGYEVWAHDANSVVVEDVHVRVTDAEHLRRRLADAKKSLRGYDKVIRELEQRAQDLVQERETERISIQNQ